MFINMITMFTKKTKGNILLGRWSTISNEKSKINYKKFKQNIDFNRGEILKDNSLWRM